MNELLLTNINYSGEVLLKLNIGNKSIDIFSTNSGTNTLHEAICRFLAGQYRGDCDIPKYIDLIETVSDKSQLYQLIQLSGRQMSSKSSMKCTTCTAVISAADISAQIDENLDYQLVLLADPDPSSASQIKRRLAYITVAGQALKLVQEGTSASIEWNLIIKNAN